MKSLAQSGKVIDGFNDKITLTSTLFKKAFVQVANVGITIALEEAVKAIIACVTASQRLETSAAKLGSEFTNTKQGIADYKKEIEELLAVTKNSNSSYEESYNARVRLLEIQDEVIDKYGTEAESINLIKDAIDGQIEALDELTAKKWRETLLEFNFDPDRKLWDKFGDWFSNKIVHGVDH